MMLAGLFLYNLLSLDTIASIVYSRVWTRGLPFLGAMEGVSCRYLLAHETYNGQCSNSCCSELVIL